MRFRRRLDYSLSAAHGLETPSLSLSLLSPECAFQRVKSPEYGFQVFTSYLTGPSGVHGLGSLQILRHRRNCRGRPVFITERHVPQLPGATFIDDKKKRLIGIRTRFLSSKFTLQHAELSTFSSDVTNRHNNVFCLYRSSVFDSNNVS